MPESECIATSTYRQIELLRHAVTYQYGLGCENVALGEVGFAKTSRSLHLIGLLFFFGFGLAGVEWLVIAILVFAMHMML